MFVVGVVDEIVLLPLSIYRSVQKGGGGGEQVLNVVLHNHREKLMS